MSQTIMEGTFYGKDAQGNVITLVPKGVSDSLVVHKVGSETINGAKTFTSTTEIQNDYPILNLVRTENSPNLSDIRFYTSEDKPSAEACIRLSNANSLSLGAKADTSAWYNGPLLMLQNDGQFVLRAQNATTGSALRGTPDGALTWVGYPVIVDGLNQNIGGKKTFTSNIAITSYPAIYNPDEGDDNVLQIIAGHTTSGAAGAKLSLAGANVNGTNQGGDFTLQAGKSGAYCQFIGKPDGTLTWGGSNVNTAANPGVKLVEYTDSTSRTLAANGSAQYTISPPSISGYTATEVVGGRGNGTTGILVGAWWQTTQAWVHNTNQASKTFTVTYLVLYTRN